MLIAMPFGGVVCLIRRMTDTLFASEEMISLAYVYELEKETTLWIYHESLNPAFFANFIDFTRGEA